MLVPEEIRKCVVFLCCRLKSQVRLAGTGFFVSIPAEAEHSVFVYLVTARHVIEGIAEKSADGNVLIRMNTRSGGTSLLSAPLANWRFHPTDPRADVAALPFAPGQNEVEYKVLPASMLISADIERRYAIGPGDEVFFPGLFVNHHGQRRNLPIVRIGNIAAMPEEPVSTIKYGEIDAYLVEARSIGGLSGSPVFVHLVLGRGGAIDLSSPSFYLLGLMHGHYNSPITELDLSLDDGGRADGVNMGIAIVIPANRIRDLIDHPDFVAARTIANEAARRQPASGPGQAVSGHT